MSDKNTPTQEINASIEYIKAFDPETCKVQVGSDPIVDFRGAYESAKKIVSLFKSINLDVLYYLPHDQRSKFFEEAHRCHELFLEMQSFDKTITERKADLKRSAKQLSSDEVLDKKRDICNRIDSTYAILYSKYFILQLKSEVAQEVDRDKVNKMLDDIGVDRKFDLTVLKDELTIKGRELAEKLTTMDELSATCRKALVDMNLIAQSSFFRSEAKENANAIFLWSIITGVVFCVLVVVASVILYTSYSQFKENEVDKITSILQLVFPKKQNNIYDYLQLALAKLVLVGILIYGLVLSARTLFAHYHNFTVNRHRHNAIASFRRFVKSLDEKDEARKLIIAQIASTVFSPQETGFISGHTEMPSIESFLKVLKDFSGSAKSTSA